MFVNDTDSFPFGVGGSPTRITHLHPSAIQIFQLWQAYISNVNSLLRISHVPTLQTQIVEACADLSKVSKPLEALMFNIYLIAVKSLTGEETQATFGESRETMLSRFNKASQQALINVGFMRSNELTVLQAFFLYLVSPIFSLIDPTVCLLLSVSSAVLAAISILDLCSAYLALPFVWQLACVYIETVLSLASRPLRLSSDGSSGGSWLH